MNNVSNQSLGVGQNVLSPQISQAQPVVDAEVVKKSGDG